jgi:hypothetical protein
MQVSEIRRESGRAKRSRRCILVLAMSFRVQNRTSNRSLEPLVRWRASPSRNCHVTHLSRIDAGLRPILSENGRGIETFAASIPGHPHKALNQLRESSRRC